MGLIKDVLEKRKQVKQEHNDLCDKLLDTIRASKSVFINKFDDLTSFIEPTEVELWEKEYAELFDFISDGKYKKVKKAENKKELKKEIEAFNEFYDNLNSSINSHNDKVAETKIEQGYSLIGNVEGRKLDPQQMLCIVKDVHNHLVVAGAGTGKTTTIIGKIKYLLASKMYEPKEIMVLSFTNASALEMKERIQKETGCNIYASTFHKLGLNIIKRVEGLPPKITNINLFNFIKEELPKQIENSLYLKSLCKYMIFDKTQSISEFESKEKYEEYLKTNPPTSLKKEKMKSYGEADIANYLALHGVDYIYEKEYEHDTRTEEYSQYYPDFYLPDYGIYIEYFGIDRNGNVPEHFSDSHDKSAKEQYNDSIKWKRSIHKEYNTKMIELYAYEREEGCLLESLEEQLVNASVDLNEVSPENIWKSLNDNNSELLSGLIELFQTIINLIKSNNYSFEDIKSLGKYHLRYNTILSLTEPIFNSYQNTLKEKDEIDFNDMINKATQYIKEHKFVNQFKYVIVDEYQDISKSRFNLLKSLRDSKEYDLFCVGDDWQSIYRFAGSDIGYILDFDKYWGPTQYSKIETTYRFSKQLIKVSSNFIMKNPSQLKKDIKGYENELFSIGEITGYKERNAIQFMINKLDELPNNSSVYFIGRYSFDYKLLELNKDLKVSYDVVSQSINVNYFKRKDLKMKFITAHKSKGLQADYVFILNNKNGIMGFPSKIQDDPIISLLLDYEEDYRFSEERRLFYVALTRARKKVYLLAVNNNESEFFQELKSEYAYEFNIEHFECPVCGGRLVKRNGKFGEFWGCSNYSSLGCKYIRK